MGNTYTQLYIHFVFAVQNRASLIQNNLEEELYKYITGIVQNNKHKMIAINGMPDHVHLLVGMKPHQSISGLLQDIKGSSSKWINEQDFVRGKFNWQEGYGAFSCSAREIDGVIKYINNQKEHHSKGSFQEEYKSFLEEFGVEFDERYILKNPE